MINEHQTNAIAPSVCDNIRLVLVTIVSEPGALK